MSKEKKESKSSNYMLAIRKDSAVLRKANELLEAVKEDTALSAFGTVTLSGVLRLAISEGLGVLEQRYTK